MYHRQFRITQREKRRKRKTYENSEGARAGGRSKLERWTVPQRRGKGEREEGATRAHLRAARPASRIAYARACICKRAAWSDETTADRLHEAPRQKGGIRTRGRARAGRRGRRGRTRAVGRRRKKGVGTSDSNYLELRADNRPIRRPVHGGFLAARPRTP